MKIVLLVILILLLLLLTAGYGLFLLGFVRVKLKSDPERSGFLKPFAPQIREGMDWFESQDPQEVSIRSYDGLRLAGWFLPAAEAKGTLLLMHGYRSSHLLDFGAIYRELHALGWNILAVDQRAHGESEGKYICFGMKERYDVKSWALYLYDRLGPESPVVLDGVSMGAATVLMSLDTGLPENVRGAIADCGYTTPKAEFRHLFRTRWRIPIPEHPLMDIAEGFTKLLVGVGFEDGSTLKSLAENRLPVLFVHGGSDRFVPTVFSRQNFEACTARKELIVVPEAGHGTSYLVDHAQCAAALRRFLDSCSRVSV